MVYDCTVYGIGFCNHYSKPSRFEATQDPLVDGLFGEAIMYHHACVCPHTLGQTSVSSEFQLCNHRSNLPSCLDACFDDALFFFQTYSAWMSEVHQKDFCSQQIGHKTFCNLWLCWRKSQHLDLWTLKSGGLPDCRFNWPTNNLPWSKNRVPQSVHRWLSTSKSQFRCYKP